MTKQERIVRRKNAHINICLSDNVRFKRTNGLEWYHFVHQAIPELNLSEIRTEKTILGKKLSAPIMAAPMTGGIPEGGEVNRNLARAAQKVGLAMGVGSQRAALVNPDLADTYRVRTVAPDILLFANLGAVQLNNGMGAEECAEAVKMIEADALMLHLNPMQEALQEGGDTNFKGLLKQIEKVVKALHIPVFVREVSCGLSREAAAKLLRTGVAGIDVGGTGGTSWAKVEGIASTQSASKEISSTFAEWGVDLAQSILNVREISREIPLIATGGIANGLDAAKAVALGADLAGVARGFLPDALESAEKVELKMERFIRELKIALFCSGIESVEALQGLFLNGGSNGY